MKIEALIPFTYRDSSTGAIYSIAKGGIVTMDDTLAEGFIADGLAKEFTLITPTGTKTITANGETDVTAYATASVEVPEPTGSENITANGTYDIKDKASIVVNVGVVTLTYNVNGGTGSVSPVTVGAGSEVALDNGSGLTLPENKAFGGWGDSASATEAIASPATITANTTVYAIWNDAT